MTVPASAGMDTPAAQHTSVWIIIEDRMVLENVRFFQRLSETFGFEAHLEKPGDLSYCQFNFPSIRLSLSECHLGYVSWKAVVDRVKGGEVGAC